YAGLHVFDSTGAVQESWFQLSEHGIAIAVDECEAVYPLTIDPVVQEAYLKASNPDALDAFGSAVAISGDRAVVGCWRERSQATGIDGDGADNSAFNAGAAYAFHRVAGAWVQDGYLKASNTDAEDRFGHAIAISGDLIVVGASGEASNSIGVNGNQLDNSAPNAGAAYVFENQGGAWQQVAYLKASNASVGDYFGSAVAIDGERIVVGARGEGSSSVGVDGDQANNSAGASGAAYVFERVAGAWTQVAYLKAHNTGSGDNFGAACALAGDRILIGAPLEDSSGTGVDGADNNDVDRAGAAYSFVRVGGIWSQDGYFKSTAPGIRDEFGQTLTITDDWAVVGTPGIDGPSGTFEDAEQGAAYAYRAIGGSWEFVQEILPLTTFGQQLFASSVCLLGSRLYVGAALDSSEVNAEVDSFGRNHEFSAGAVYVFDWNGVAWVQQRTVRATYQGGGDGFGSSAQATPSYLIVGAPGEDSGLAGVDRDPSDDSMTLAGAAYIFNFDVPSENFCGPSAHNLSGRSATISYSGSLSVASNDFVLHADGMTTQRLGYFLSSRTQGWYVQPGGARGNLCLGGTSPI
ncbi:MAG: FG-GAP repeat protein, partial [Planctomycetes bacterium]|nr:FG-GAP repeat protein [Planctomycetota bacterium]